MGTTNLYVSPCGNDAWNGLRADRKPGTAEGPFASVVRARDAVRACRRTNPDAAVRVLIRGGVYPLAEPIEFGPRDSGAPNARVIYANYRDEVPCLDAGRAIPGWRQPVRPPEGLPAKARRHVWVARVPKGWRFAQLSWNGRPLARSAWPANGDWHTWPRAPLAKTQRALRVAARDLPSGEAGRCAELNFLPTPYTFWSNALTDVVRIDRKRGLLQFSPFTMHRPEKLREIPWRLENCLAGVSEPGHWFLDYRTGTVYLWPPDNADPNGAHIVAPFLTEAIRLGRVGAAGAPVRHITFRGLEIRHTNNAEPSAAQRLHATGAAIRLTGVEDVRVERCTIHDIGGNAIAATGHARRVRVSGCHIFDAAGAGISLTGTLRDPEASCAGNIVEACHIHHGGRLFWHSSAIAFGFSERGIIRRNRIHDMPYIGISTGGVRHRWFENWPRPFPEMADLWARRGTGRAPTIPDVKKLIPGHNRIEGNDVGRCMQVLDDGAAIYCHAGHHNVLRHNRVWRTGSDSSHGLYFDDEEMMSVMEHNIVDHCPDRDPTQRGSCLHLHNNGGHTIRNNLVIGGNRLFTFPNAYGGHTITRNIFVFGSAADVSSTPAPVVGRGDGRRAETWTLGASVMDGNLYWSTGSHEALDRFLAGWREAGFDHHSIVADPRLADASSADYSLRKGSPADRIGFRDIDMSRVAGRP